MTIQRESTEEPDRSNADNPSSQTENHSWLTDLLDLRVVVFLVSVVVVAMTATVLILSRGAAQRTNNDPTKVNDNQNRPALETTSNESNQIVESGPSKDVTADSSTPLVPSVGQNSDGSLELPIQSASVSGCETANSGITNWSSVGSARWRLDVSDRRTGFFYCYVTYQSKFESKFAIQLGERKPLKLTLYPHLTDFTEQIIVRLDKPDKPTFRLIAANDETGSGVLIKKIRLVPR